MRRSFPVLALFLLVCGLLAHAACSSSTSPTSTTTTTAAATVNETFTGTLGKNGAFTHQFAVTAPGTVTVLLNSVLPDSNIAIGMSVGAWNGSACATFLANDRAVVGNSLVGAASGAGTLCVRVYDIGTIPQSEDYVVLVTHP